jgi:hypothetical protein
MPEHVREVIAGPIGIPDQVIDGVGDVLDWSVMRGKRVEKEVMTKRLEDQERALDERIITNEELIIPDQLTLQGGKPRNDTDYE